jgi:hypothetical protein
MKDFPKQVKGPMGPWYQKVNASIEKARLAKTPLEIRGFLGEPDNTIEVPDDDRRQNANSPIDPRDPELILIYRDPYRPRVEYRFGISNGRVIGFTKVRHAA